MVIFIDSNVPMYLTGAAHRHKRDAQRILEELVAEGHSLVTDAEVMQEILHRYTAIERRQAIQPTLDALLGIVDYVLPIEADTVTRAKEIVLSDLTLSARDAIHVAAMELRSIDTLVSFDRDFDRVPGLRRLHE